MRLADGRILAVVPVIAARRRSRHLRRTVRPGTGSWTSPNEGEQGRNAVRRLLDHPAGRWHGAGRGRHAHVDRRRHGHPGLGRPVRPRYPEPWCGRHGHPDPDAERVRRAAGRQHVRVSSRIGRVWVANTDGTGAHELIRDLNPDLIGTQSAPAWSSDGTRLVFSQARDGDASGASRFYVTDASGSAAPTGGHGLRRALRARHRRRVLARRHEARLRPDHHGPAGIDQADPGGLRGRGGRGQASDRHRHDRPVDRQGHRAGVDDVGGLPAAPRPEGPRPPQLRGLRRP